MLTRRQARKEGIVITNNPLPTTSRKTSRKTKKTKRTNDDNIDSGDAEAILAEIAALPVVGPSVLKKPCTDLDKEPAKKEAEIIRLDTLPVVQKPWARWQSFLRKLYDKEPTDAEYDQANALWEYILKTANGIMQTNSKTSNSPKFRLYRDFRGGKPDQRLIDMITDPEQVFIQTRSSLIGFSDRPISVYLKRDDVESGMDCLRMIGWTGPMYDPNDYSVSMHHMFY